jgi:hypothetical protein
MMYRRLVNAGWVGLRASGHAHDTILIGELAARGMHHGPKAVPQGWPGDYGETKPLPFIRTLYCVNGENRPLTSNAIAGSQFSGGRREKIRVRG